MKAFALALATLLLAAAPLHAQTREVTDDAGRTVTIPETLPLP